MTELPTSRSMHVFNGDRQQVRLIYRAIAKELLKRPPRPYWHLLPKDDPVFIRNSKNEKLSSRRP